MGHGAPGRFLRFHWAIDQRPADRQIWTTVSIRTSRIATPLQNTTNKILQLWDSVSNRRCTLRMDPADASLPLGALLERYLEQAHIDRFLQESRITQPSADALYALQDLVYVSTDAGELKSMFTGMSFREGEQVITLDQIPTNHTVQVDGQETLIVDITIDRINLQYDRNWTGFHRRKWLRNEPRYSAFMQDSLVKRFGPHETEAILQLKTTGQKLQLLKSLAKTIWEGQFENYSRFIGKKLVYKSGDETIDNILEGAGAICSEKVQALKFLTDHYGLESEYIIAGENATGPVPVDKLRELLTTFDFRYSKRYMRFWQHTALLYDIDGTPVLVDATNGNIPFLFLQGDEAEGVLGYQDKVPVTVKMVEANEDFYYHRVPQDIPQDLFFALEGWVAFSDLMQVFDNELGLYLSRDFYVMPLDFTTEKEFNRDRQEYLNVSQRAGLKCSITHDWSLDSPLGEEFSKAEPVVAERVFKAGQHLLHRLDECDGPGHQAGLVIMKLGNQTPAPLES